MNYANIFKSEEEILEQERQEKLKEYGLDDESIKKFRSKIKKIPESETELLSQELIEKIVNNCDNSIIADLIYKGANVNYFCTASEYLPILSYCIRHNKLLYFKLLLRAGIKFYNDDIIECVRCNRDKMLEILSLLGANLNIKDFCENTLIEIAQKQNNKKCLEFLEKNLNNKYQINNEIKEESFQKVKNINKKIIEQPELKLDFLNRSDVFGNSRLEVFKILNARAAITDFATVLGGYKSNDFTVAINDLEFMAVGDWWSKSRDCYNYNICVFAPNGLSNFLMDATCRTIGVRPITIYSSISDFCKNEKTFNRVQEVEFGEYPQWVVDEELSEILEDLYKNNNLNKTGRYYTTDSRKWTECEQSFEPIEHIEYEYSEKKYVRVRVMDNSEDGYILSNGKEYVDDEYVWISVDNLKWIVDEKSDIAISKYIIVSGIQFNSINNYNLDNFDEMNIKKFMDNYLSKEIISNKINENIKNILDEENKPQTLLEALKEAKKQMNEILEETSYQKVKNRW